MNSLAGLSNAFSAVCSPLFKASVHFSDLNAFPHCFWPKMPGWDTVGSHLAHIHRISTQEDMPLSHARHDLKAQAPAELLSGCKICTWGKNKKGAVLPAKECFHPWLLNSTFINPSPPASLHHFSHP